MTAFEQALWIAGGIGALLFNCFMHWRSEGRTSPLAAFSFVAFAVVGIFVVGGPYVIAEVNAQYTRGAPLPERTTSDDVYHFFFRVFAASLILSASVACVAAFVKRDTWFNHL